MCIYHNFFIHSSVDGRLGCFHVLAIINSAAGNIGIHMSFSILVSSGYMLRSGIDGSYGGFINSFLWTLHTIFNTGYINLEGWDGAGDGREVQKGGDISKPMIDSY